LSNLLFEINVKKSVILKQQQIKYQPTGNKEKSGPLSREAS